MNFQKTNLLSCVLVLATGVIAPAFSLARAPVTTVFSEQTDSSNELLFYMGLQDDLRAQDRTSAELSNIVQAEHDTENNILKNIASGEQPSFAQLQSAAALFIESGDQIFIGTNCYYCLLQNSLIAQDRSFTTLSNELEKANQIENQLFLNPQNGGDTQLPSLPLLYSVASLFIESGQKPGAASMMAPEIDPSTAITAFTLLIGGMTVLNGRRYKNS